MLWRGPPLCRASLLTSLGIPMGLFEMRSLATMLPHAFSLRLKIVMECAYPTCYKCLFLPLLGSLLGFSSGRFSRLRFCSLFASLLPLLFPMTSLQLFCLPSLLPDSLSGRIVSASYEDLPVSRKPSAVETWRPEANILRSLKHV